MPRPTRRRPPARSPSRSAALRSPSPPPVAAAGWLRRRGPIVALAMVIGLALAARVAPAWSTVFPRAGETRLLDTDSYYHLRHARSVASHFPRVARLDAGIYPTAHRALYAGLFDVAMAGASLALGGGERTLERVAAWTPPVLAVAVFAGVFLLARLVAGAWAGALAACLLLLYPGVFITKSLLGAADHHVAEVVLAVWTAVGLTRLAELERERPARWWRPAFAHAAPLAMLFYTWYGAPIHLVAIGLSLLLALLVEVARGGAPMFVGRIGFRYFSALLLLLLASALAARWLIMEPTRFWLSIAAIAVLAAGLPVLARALALAAARVGPLAAALAGLGFVAAGAVVFVALAPSMQPLLAELVGAKTLLVSEQFPLTPGLYLALGGPPAALGLAALPLALRDSWRRRRCAPLLLPSTFATLLVVLWLLTRDYNYLAGPFLAFMAAAVLVGLARRLPARVPRVAAAAALAALLLSPLAWVDPRGEPVQATHQLRALRIFDDGWASAVTWMRKGTPPLAVSMDEVSVRGRPDHPPGNYGVLVYWPYGHFVNAVGERPATGAGAFDRESTAWLLLTDEERAAAALRPPATPGRRIRYVVVDAQSAGGTFLPLAAELGLPPAAFEGSQRVALADGTSRTLPAPGDRFRRSMLARLYLDDGDGLSRFRMVYASPARSAVTDFLMPGGLRSERLTKVLDEDELPSWTAVASSGVPEPSDGGLLYNVRVGPSVKIFEQVAGARLAGGAAPGAEVEASLSLMALQGRHLFTWRRRATADAAGRFEIIVPYATDRDPHSDVQALGVYQIVTASDGQAVGDARVRPAEIDSGAEVRVKPAGR